MTIIYHGWTPAIPMHEQIANGIAACKAFLERDPDNVYWQNRLEAYEQQRILDNLTPEAQAEYMREAITAYRAEELDWLDEMSTRESVRPL